MPDKAPVCPWCDTPKDGVSINGIRILENCGNQYGPKQKANFCPLCGRPLTEEAAMKRFETMQKPLTVEEMEELGGDGGAVYVLSGSGIEEFAIVIGGSPSSPIDALYVYPCGGTLFNAVGADQETYDGDFYAMRDVNSKPHPLGWIAFRRKPTEEERKAAKWDDK